MRHVSRGYPACELEAPHFNDDGAAVTTDKQEHEKWLASHGLADIKLPRIYEDPYTGLIAAALLGATAVRTAVIAALLPGHPNLIGADVTYMSVPRIGIDLTLLLKSNSGVDSGIPVAVHVEHKRRKGRGNHPKLATYKRQAPGHETCKHHSVAQKRRRSDPPTDGITQLDAVVCFDDWRDEFTEKADVAARIFLDTSGRSANSVLDEAMTHPDAWTTLGYEHLGKALRNTYDAGQHDPQLRPGLAPLLRGLYAF